MDGRILGLIVVAALAATQQRPVGAYKILMIPIPGRSHVFSMAAMAEGLAGRGHRVSLLVGEHFPTDAVSEVGGNSSISMIRHGDTDENGAATDYVGMSENVTMHATVNRFNMWSSIPDILYYRDRLCNNVIRNNDALMTKLEAQEFDLAVVDATFFMKCFYLVPHRLRIPWVTYSDAANPLVIRVPWLPSFVPHVALPLTDRMNFVDRLRNSLLMAASLVYSPFPDPPSPVLDEYRRYGSFRDLDELASRSQLWLLTRNIVLDYPKPMMPKMVDVGGLTVRRTSGKLATDMKRFVEEASHGTIVMTFGSSMSILPATIAKKFVSAFRRLDGYRIVWRLNNGHDVEMPDNVMISRWLPQNDLLAHPSVKLFNAHGGNNGQFEAVYHGVPMISFPINIADQAHNARRIAHKGYGLSMDLNDFTSDQLVDNIHRIMEDVSFKQRVMKASEIFRSQAQYPVERATFWIEHVCRFGGDHLRSAGDDLPLHSYLMLDLLAVIVSALIIILYLFIKLAMFVKSKCATKQDVHVKYD